MGLDIWFAEDIRNALLAVNEASSATAAVAAEGGVDPVTLRAYREGYKAALATVALAFGIAPQTIVLGHPFDVAQDVAQDKARRQAPDRALRQAQDRPLDELGTIQAQDGVLRVGAQYEIPQRDGVLEVSPSCHPKWGRAEGRKKASIHTCGSGEGP